MFAIRIDDAGTIILSGRLDASQAAVAEAVLDRVTASAVADCRDLDYISSAGISVLLTLYKRLHDTGHTLRLTRVSDRVRNVFRYAGLDKVFLLDE